MSSKSSIDKFVADVSSRLGQDAVNVSPDTLARYGENTSPGADVPPAAVLFPASSADVQTIVQSANAHNVPVYPISMGQNIGHGSRAPMAPDQVVIDLGRRMNRILEVNEELGYCVIEPGVSFQAMYDELRRRNSHLMISTTGGPPQGSLVGNALERGGGSGPYADHFGSLCGLEVVLGNGDLLRCGDGNLDSTSPLNWHLSKNGYGPGLDGLFAQSNYGIVTRASVWLGLRPPATETFIATFPDDGDLHRLIDLARGLKLSNFVPSRIRIINDLYLISAEEPDPEFRPGGPALSEAGRKALQKKYGLGSWTVAGAFYGASRQALQPQLERVQSYFATMGKGRFIPADEVKQMSPLQRVLHGFAGVPSEDELRMLRWRPGGGLVWFLPSLPMIGSVVDEMHRITRATCERYGFEYLVTYSCGPRSHRGTHPIIFNRQDPDESRRADACYRDLTVEFAKRGMSVGRSPAQYQSLHQKQRVPTFQATCNAIKKALDPNGIIAPGRYGIGSES